ncbi:MAG TPA: hypothetical protein VKD72_31935 [Gemmataceae bacterium]|nr:hypothetical protein [Gemmataceae bacterium]
MKRLVFCLCSAALLTLPPAGRVAADDDVADVLSQDLRAGKDDNKRYFLIGPGKDVKEPKKGFGLLIVMPGGPGDEKFHPFVKRIAKNALSETYLVAQPVAVKWTEKQQTVWPTDKNRVEKMKFTTEEFVAAVIDDVEARHKLNPQHVFTLSWSSSGPAAYPVSLTNQRVTGSFIAMSVFRPDWMPPLEKAKGHAYYLFHSPDDTVCPYRDAQYAEEELKKNAAKVWLADYDGGHGWHGDVFENIRRGVEWLEKNHAEPPGK